MPRREQSHGTPSAPLIDAGIGADLAIQRLHHQWELRAVSRSGKELLAAGEESRTGDDRVVMTDLRGINEYARQARTRGLTIAYRGPKELVLFSSVQ